MASGWMANRDWFCWMITPLPGLREGAFYAASADNPSALVYYFAVFTFLAADHAP